MSTITSQELRDNLIAQAVNQALQRAVLEVDARRGLQGGAMPGDGVFNGTYDGSGDFVVYEVSGDVAGVNPIGP